MPCKLSDTKKSGHSKSSETGLKKLVLALDGQHGLIESEHSRIRIARPCALVGRSRSSFDSGVQGERAENLNLRRLLDEWYTRKPFDGIRRMTVWLRQQGYTINPKRVARLLPMMGLETIYPTPRLSHPHPEGRIYPYVWRGGADDPGASGLEHRQHRYPAPAGHCLLGRGDGLVQPVCALVGGFDHDGRGVLSGGMRASTQEGHSGHLSQRSRPAVDGCRPHRPVQDS